VNEEAMIEQTEGKAAPMPLLAVQAFANTLDLEEGTDALADRSSFRGWLEDSGLIARGFKVGPADLKAARTLRDALREALEANASGRLDPEAASTLAAQAGTWRIELDCDGDGRFTLDLQPAKSMAELGSQLLGVVFQAQVDGSWERLKICENEECAWAFYDSSRNRSGSWCRMGVCGNRIKNRAYRARQRSSQS
jgi:predicted RNA-binding Zn ribbon-like protein